MKKQTRSAFDVECGPAIRVTVSPPVAPEPEAKEGAIEMAQNVLVLGARGSMGRRYLAVLRHLGVAAWPVDLLDTDGDEGRMRGAVNRRADAGQIHGVIVATPTATHARLVEWLRRRIPAPILVEKPLSKHLGEVEAIATHERVTMMEQYRLLDAPEHHGVTSYDYYHSGGDGLAWDCIQLIGLARDAVRLSTLSPVWRAQLNGKELSLESVHVAVVTFVRDWLAGTLAPRRPEWLLDLHRETAQVAAYQDQAIIRWQRR